MARIGMTLLPRRLAEHTGQPAPTYRRCFDYGVGARFPAEFVNNRWTVDEADLDVIALALGMTPLAAAPKQRRATSRQPIQAAA